MDLIQLRWMQVRTFEMQQATERENIDLRKELADLRSFAQSNSGMHKVALRTLSKNLYEWLQRLKLEIKTLKTTYQAEIEKSKITLSLFGDLFKKMLGNQTILLKDNDKLKKNNGELAAELEKCRKDSVAAVNIKSQEIDRLKTKIIKLQEELGSQDHLNSNRQTEVDKLKGDLDASQKEKVAITTKYEASNAECKRLRALIAKLENDFAVAETNLRNEHESHWGAYKTTTNEMMEQMAKLRSVIIEQQEEIERLSRAVHGNKSHFAKFVELKEENVALTSKLKTILGEIPSYDPIGGVFVGKANQQANSQGQGASNSGGGAHSSTRLQSNSSGSTQRPSGKSLQKPGTKRFSDLAASIPDPSMEPVPKQFPPTVATKSKVRTNNNKGEAVNASGVVKVNDVVEASSETAIGNVEGGSVIAIDYDRPTSAAGNVAADARVRDLLKSKYGLDLTSQPIVALSTANQTGLVDSIQAGGLSRSNSSRRGSSAGRLSTTSLQYMYDDDDGVEDAVEVVRDNENGNVVTTVIMEPSPPHRDGSGGPYKRDRKHASSSSNSRSSNSSSNTGIAMPTSPIASPGKQQKLLASSTRGNSFSKALAVDPAPVRPISGGPTKRTVTTTSTVNTVAINIGGEGMAGPGPVRPGSGKGRLSMSVANTRHIMANNITPTSFQLQMEDRNQSNPQNRAQQQQQQQQQGYHPVVANVFPPILSQQTSAGTSSISTHNAKVIQI